jgi:hydrogenase maturation factor
MPANFTSGWLGNNEVAWHGLGVVTEGTLPAREAFETADALFTVEKRELLYPT